MAYLCSDIGKNTPSSHNFANAQHLLIVLTNFIVWQRRYQLLNIIGHFIFRLLFCVGAEKLFSNLLFVCGLCEAHKIEFILMQCEKNLS